MRLVDITNGEIIVAVADWEAPYLAELSHLAELGSYDGQPTEDKSHLETEEIAILASALSMFWEAAGLVADHYSVSKHTLRVARATRAHIKAREGSDAARDWQKVERSLEPSPPEDEAA